MLFVNTFLLMLHALHVHSKYIIIATHMSNYPSHRSPNGPRYAAERRHSSPSSSLKRIGAAALLTYSTFFMLDNAALRPLAATEIERMLPDTAPGLSKKVSTVASQAFERDTSVTCADLSPFNTHTSRYSYKVEGATVMKQVDMVPFGYRIGIDPVTLRQTSNPTRFYMSEAMCSEVASAFDGIPDDTPEYEKLSSAFFVMFHEQQHVEGVANEAKASCLALQRMPRYLEQLRFSDTAVRSMVHQIKAEYPTKAREDYIDAIKCQPGGEYDLGIDGPFAQPVG